MTITGPAYVLSSAIALGAMVARMGWLDSIPVERIAGVMAAVFVVLFLIGIACAIPLIIIFLAFKLLIKLMSLGRRLLRPAPILDPKTP